MQRLGTFLLEVDGLILTGKRIDDHGEFVDRFTLIKRIWPESHANSFEGGPTFLTRPWLGGQCPPTERCGLKICRPWFFEQFLEVSSVVVGKLLGEFLDLRDGDVAHPIGNLFDAGDLEPLP